MARLNISLTNEVAKKIQQHSEDDSKTISSIITESVDLYFALRQMGLTKSQMIKLLRFQEMSKEMGSVPIPGVALDVIMNVALENSEEKTLELWCDGGRVLGELFKSTTPDINRLASDIKEYSSFVPVSKLELKNENGNVEFIVMGSGYSIGSAKVTAAGVKCFLEVYGVKNIKESISEGFVKLTGTVDNEKEQSRE